MAEIQLPTKATQDAIKTAVDNLSARPATTDIMSTTPYFFSQGSTFISQKGTMQFFSLSGKGFLTSVKGYCDYNTGTNMNLEIWIDGNKKINKILTDITTIVTLNGSSAVLQYEVPLLYPFNTSLVIKVVNNNTESKYLGSINVAASLV